MGKKIFLDISFAMRKFALSFGACYDRKTKEWYFDGEDIPIELEDFIVQNNRSRDYTIEESPSCPKCGCYMIQRSSATYQFWGCSRYPDCRGSADMGRKANTFQRAFSLCNVDHSLDKQISPNNDGQLDSEVTQIRKEIIRETLMCFGREDFAVEWLNSSKVGLEGNSPMSQMSAPDGCEKVIKLLMERFPQAFSYLKTEPTDDNGTEAI